MKLSVFLGNEKAGSLESTDNRGVIFIYDKNYLMNKNAVPLSASLPLQSEEFSQKQCIPFFSGLLPEEDSRKKIADYLHISETSTLKLLEALGGECAGLISILTEGDSLLYDVVSTVIYPGLTEKLSMKIGKHYEIQKVSKEDFSLLAESLNIKYTIFQKIFDDFGKKYISAFEELKADEKVSADILNSIFEVVETRF
ncbi:MAG: HipA N-terminal domain-containing protein [Treponema sp.]|uniref:HipA N-terminal domain-containing protein n=1 Tax=Treponema sp. TaxID=166 RepID=UPI002A90C88B|nr:HipA N-terminal domain-containing protein [Treponema sp.]MDY6397769.1 HipA N-terminal domain-containing protein [Treponema sp.]